MRGLTGLSVLTLALVLGAGASVRAQAVATADTRQVKVPMVAAAPAIDGTLNDPAWKNAMVVHLGYDYHTYSTVVEPTTVMLVTDGKALYVGFSATQTRTPILTNQHTNNVGQDTDDEAIVNLWPNGSTGFAYQFIATALGTRYQNSSENQIYEPKWDAAGHVDGTTYTVTMRIPLGVMRGANKDKWLIQLSRYEPTTGAEYVYNGGSAMNGNSDPLFARPLLGMPAGGNSRPQSRFGAYALGAVSSANAGGDTSRVGLDFSVPITSGTSFVGTLHPDFSNVESDQQTISPNAFQKYYQETRPFFTQGSNAYDYYECDECVSISNLYTPNIPTPREGYAVEGSEGPAMFGAFDSIGIDGRNDDAQGFVLRNTPRTFFLTDTRVNVTMPGFTDTSDFAATKWNDGKHKFIFANFADETGTNVTDPSKARMYMIGGGWYGQNTFAGGNIIKMGSQYDPYDGFVSFNDVAGYGFFRNQNWNPHGGAIKHVSIFAFIDRYHATGGALNNTDQAVGLDITTRKLWDFQTLTGAAYALIGNTFTPLTQNTTALTYHFGTATPTQLQFADGSYGNGKLKSWYRSTTFNLTRRTTMTLEADDTRQYLFGGGANVQWLERVSVNMQTGADSSFAVGLRRFSGAPPTPNGGGICGTISNPYRPFDPNYIPSVCSNISFAYHKKFGKRELYVAYGNPSQLFTTPQFLIKIIDYVGADKGT
jgi:hypothetical protein